MAIQPISSKIPKPGKDFSPTRPRTSTSSATVRIASQLLVNRWDRFISGKKGSYFSKTMPITPPLIESALDSLIPFGVYAVSGAGTSRWICLDADSDALWPQLVTLARQLAPQGNVLLERSRRGGHLWFFHQVTTWDHAHAYGVQLAQDAVLEGIEIYPKFNELHGVRCPGTVHVKTGLVYPIIDPMTGEVLSIDEALATITPIILPAMELSTSAETAQDGAVSEGNSEKPDRSDEFLDLVAELSRLTTVRVYRANHGSARCVWHDDHSPSLYIKGPRFHCLSAKCGVFGDVHDVRRFIERGTLPPKGD